MAAKNNLDLIQFCKNVRRRYQLSRLLRVLFNAGSVGLAILTLLNLVFALFPWVILPVLFDCFVVAIVLWVAVQAITLYITQAIPLLTVARLVEQKKPGIHHFLSASIEMDETNVDGSLELKEMVSDRARAMLATYPIKLQPLVHRPHAMMFACAAAALAATSLFVTPRLLTWWNLPFTMTRRIEATIHPGTCAIRKQGSVTLRLEPNTVRLPSARLTLTELLNTHQQNSFLLRPDSAGNFSLRLDSLAHSYRYQFSIGTTAFAPETITVVPPPMLYGMQATIRPPAYTGIGPQRQSGGNAALAVYAGSTVDLTVHSIFPLKNASLILDDKPQTLATAHDSAWGSFTVMAPGRYTFSLQDTLGQRSDSLPSFPITIVPDYPPGIRIVKPGENITLTEVQQETLWVEAADDFGITLLDLQWRKSSEPPEAVESRSILPQGKEASKSIHRSIAWNIGALSLYPGDSLFYWCRTADNRTPAARQYAVSDTFFFRVPTFEEIITSVDKENTDAHQAIAGTRKLQQQMQRKIESLLKNTEGNDEMSWDERKTVEELQELARENRDSLGNAIAALQNAVEKLRESAVGDDLLKKMDEVQKSLKSLLENYSDSLFLKNLQPQNSELSWQEMKKSLEKMAQQLPDLASQLDNTLQFLEMLKQESHRAMLAAMAQQLAKQQDHLRQARDTDPQTLPMQKELSSDIQKLLDELRKTAESDTTSPVSIQKLSAQDSVASINKAMQSSTRSNRLPSPETMNKMSGALRSLSHQLEETLQMNAMAKMMQDRDRLVDMAQSTLNLSQWQQQLLNEKGSRPPDLSVREQQSLRESVMKTTAMLDSLATAPPEMLRRLKAVADSAAASMKSLLQSPQLQGQSGNPSQRLNTLASALLSSADAMMAQASGQQQGSGMSGLMAGLRQLTSRQATINSATSQLLKQLLEQQSGSGQGQAGSGAEGAEEGASGPQGGKGSEALQAAREAQKKLADQLNELSGKYGKTTEPDLKNRIEELENEARRIATMFERPTFQIEERQDRFLSRMLQATMSLHKQDEEKEERKSKSATTIFLPENNATARGATPFDATDTFYRLRMKALAGNFPPAYRPAVWRYFDSLSVRFLKPVKP